MLISELMRELAELKIRHGDLEVHTAYDEISCVEYNDDDGEVIVVE